MNRIIEIRSKHLMKAEDTTSILVRGPPEK